MSDEEKDDFFKTLRVIKAMLCWLLGGAGAALLGLLVLGISDHYDQKNLRQEVEWMRPKVERLWYRSNLDSSASGVPPTLVLSRQP